VAADEPAREADGDDKRAIEINFAQTQTFLIFVLPHRGARACGARACGTRACEARTCEGRTCEGRTCEET
jgi:hypothetical protein